MSFERQIVHTPSLFSVDEKFDDPRFQKVRVAVMHSGKNRNNSYFSKDVILDAKDSFKNIPILADIVKYTDEFGVEHMDYAGHTMHIEENAFNPGENKVIYDEKIVGVIPETNNFELVYDEETKNYYATIDAMLYREYGNYCCEILNERGGMTDVSAEIGCDDLSYSAQDKCLVVGKMVMSGVTLLGENVVPGMAKAHAETFSIKENDRTAQMIEIMQELKKSLDNYTAAITANDNARKEEQSKVFEKLLEKYGKTIEEIEFAYEEMTDDQLVEAFALAFDEDAVDGEGEGDAAGGSDDDANIDIDDSDDETTGDTTGEGEGGTPGEGGDGTPDAGTSGEGTTGSGDAGTGTSGSTTEDDEDEDTSEDEDSVNDADAKKVRMSYEDKTFSVSLNDKIYALTMLVNDTYGELDGDYYSVDVYDDEGYVVMHGWNRSFRQSFKKKKCCSYSLVGDRAEVFSVWMTEDERTAFDKMKADFSSISEKLSKYECENDKLEVLNSDEYAYVASTEEFENLKLQENHFDMTVEEVKNAADGILLSYVKSGAFKFSADNDGVVVASKKLPKTETKVNRYGTLFS